jgi:hypothetical protein
VSSLVSDAPLAQASSTPEIEHPLAKTMVALRLLIATLANWAKIKSPKIKGI